MRDLVRTVVSLLCFLSFFLICSGFGTEHTGFEQEIIDLKNRLLITNSDTGKIDLLYKLAKALRGFDNKEAEKYARQGLKISQNAGFRIEIAMGNNILGTIKLELGQYVEADSFLNQGMRYARKKDLELNAHLNNSLGILNSELDYNEQSNEYFHKSAFLFSSINKDYTAAIIKLNIAIIFSKTGKNDKAIELSRELVSYFKGKNDIEQLIHVFNDLSGFFYTISELDSAEFYCRKSLCLSDTTKNKDDITVSNLNLGRIFSKRELYTASNEFLLKALNLADTLSSVQNQTDISKYLSNNYAALGDSGKAFYYLSLYNKNEKELNKIETAKNLAKRKLTEISKNLKTKEELFYISVICLIISLLLIITLYLNFRIKKKANRLLTEMDELKSKLFSNLTHEFRTPLTLILGPLEELLSEGEKRILTRHEIKVMRKNAKRLLNLVNQMLDLAKLDAKSMKIELTEDDFNLFFKMIVSSFSTAAEQKGIRFTWTVPKESFPVFFDADKLEKIINNLVSNALKYTDRGGEVNCSLEIIDKKKELVRFCVFDSGKGIKTDHLPRIFDRFYQAETPGPDSFSTGIGLSLTKELIALLNGEIEVKSEWGKGSEFTVTLPLGYKHLDKTEYSLVEIHREGKSGLRGSGGDLPEESQVAVSEISPAGKKDLPVVLIAEDQSEIRSYMIDHLKDDFRMMQAENGAKAFELAIQNIPDLVITDLIMPEMDGMELSRKLKTDERTSHIPVIILTARTGMEDKLEGLETGADQYLTKPFHMKELRLLVRKLIEQRNQLRVRFSRDVRLEPKDIAITPADEVFLNRVLAVIEKHMGDFEFEINIFQDEMAMSRMQLFRKIKALTDQTPGEFIRTIRLKRAAKLIEQGFGNIAQVCFEVGFNNPSYFAKCFREIYGMLPSEYAHKHKPDHIM